MSLPPGFVRVTRRHPCTVCGRPDWCMRNCAFAYCTRVESDHIAMNAYRHPLDAQHQGTTIHYPSRERPPINASALCDRYRSLVDPEQLRRHADSLGLSVPSLRRLGIGWFPEEEAWSFPMVSGRMQVVGVRLRNEEARKWAVAGSKTGLFVPTGLTRSPRRLYLPEGPTSTAAMFDMGLPAVGRPDCNGGTSDLIEMFSVSKPAIVIVADNDPHGAGERGAVRMAEAFRLRKWPVSVLLPPNGIKDPRDWKRAGATRADIESVESAC